MALNCKPGDLAVIVRSSAGNTGKVVTCIRLATRAEIDAHFYSWKNEPMWVTDKPTRTTWGNEDCFMFDSCLRPLRDNPGADETLTWAPVPHKEKA